MGRTGIIAAAAILAALLIASVAVALLRGESELDAGSPEAAVQRYIRALTARDFDGVYSMWAPEIQERCAVEEVAVGRRYDYDLETLEEARVALDDVEEVGDLTNVRVKATYTSGGMFVPSQYTNRMTFSLRQYDGDWRIVHHYDPWFECISERGDDPQPVATPRIVDGG